MPQHVLAGMISIPSFAWEPTSSKLHMAVVTTRWNEPGTLHHCVIGKHGNVESSHLIASGTDIDWPTLGTPGIMIRIGAVVVTAATRLLATGDADLSPYLFVPTQKDPNAKWKTFGIKYATMEREKWSGNWSQLLTISGSGGAYIYAFFPGKGESSAIRVALLEASQFQPDFEDQGVGCHASAASFLLGDRFST